MIWTSETPVILYGAAHRGISVYRYLSPLANIVAFIDKRSDEIECCEGIPVVSIEAADRNSLVVVCVNNIFDHENIAMHLCGYGYKSIVFCPVDDSNISYRTKHERDRLNRIYGQIINSALKLPIDVPDIAGLMTKEYKDNSILCEINGTLIANIPTMFVYGRAKGNSKFIDYPLLALYPHIELFDYYSGKIDTNYRIYIETQCRVAATVQGVIQTEKWVQNVLDSRRMIYERMRVSEEINPRFFEEHAVPGVWNDSGGYFNIESGKHRAAYLIHRDRLFIPIRISSNDYEKYLNIDAVVALQEHFASGQISQLPYPVWHPYFYNIPFKVGSNYYDVLRLLALKVAHYFGERKQAKTMKNISIWNLSYKLEGLTQGLAKLGCKISTSYTAKEFDLLVRRLYHIPEIGICNGQGRFDIIIGENIEQVQEYDASIYCVLTPENGSIVGDGFEALLRMGDDIFSLKVKSDFNE